MLFRSSEIVRTGVFGKNEEGKIKDRLVFSANNLVSWLRCVVV